MINNLDFLKHKAEKKTLKLITCYDSWSAQIIAETEIDAVLVGDSLSMVMHGEANTLKAHTELMALHTQAVARGLGGQKFIIGDLPFLSYRKSLRDTMLAVETLMQAGAHAVKLEGVSGHEDHIKHIVESGVPVMGHIGLTPQSVHALGGFKVQGKNEAQAQRLFEEAQKLQDLGCFSLVLECIPGKLAQEITSMLKIPSIGIGAGPHCDGQILVLQDMLGMNGDFKAKFLKQYLDGKTLIKKALNSYCHEIEHQLFPTEKESYSYG